MQYHCDMIKDTEDRCCHLVRFRGIEALKYLDNMNDHCEHRRMCRYRSFHFIVSGGKVTFTIIIL